MNGFFRVIRGVVRVWLTVDAWMRDDGPLEVRRFQHGDDLFPNRPDEADGR